MTKHLVYYNSLKSTSQATYFSLGLTSHKGARIKTSIDSGSYYYDVMVEIKDLNNPKEKESCNSVEDYNYRKCVDDFVFSDMFKVIILDFLSIIEE